MMNTSENHNQQQQTSPLMVFSPREKNESSSTPLKNNTDEIHAGGSERGVGGARAGTRAPSIEGTTTTTHPNVSYDTGVKKASSSVYNQSIPSQKDETQVIDDCGTGCTKQTSTATVTTTNTTSNTTRRNSSALPPQHSNSNNAISLQNQFYNGPAPRRPGAGGGLARDDSNSVLRGIEESTGEAKRIIAAVRSTVVPSAIAVFNNGHHQNQNNNNNNTNATTEQDYTTGTASKLININNNNNNSSRPIINRSSILMSAGGDDLQTQTTANTTTTSMGGAHYYHFQNTKNNNNNNTTNLGGTDTNTQSTNMNYIINNNTSNISRSTQQSGQIDFFSGNRVGGGGGALFASHGGISTATNDKFSSQTGFSMATNQTIQYGVPRKSSLSTPSPSCLTGGAAAASNQPVFGQRRRSSGGADLVNHLLSSGQLSSKQRRSVSQSLASISHAAHSTMIASSNKPHEVILDLGRKFQKVTNTDPLFHLSWTSMSHSITSNTNTHINNNNRSATPPTISTQKHFLSSNNVGSTSVNTNLLTSDAAAKLLASSKNFLSTSAKSRISGFLLSSMKQQQQYSHLLMNYNMMSDGMTTTSGLVVPPPLLTPKNHNNNNTDKNTTTTVCGQNDEENNNNNNTNNDTTTAPVTAAEFTTSFAGRPSGVNQQQLVVSSPQQRAGRFDFPTTSSTVHNNNDDNTNDIMNKAEHRSSKSEATINSRQRRVTINESIKISDATTTNPDTHQYGIMKPTTTGNFSFSQPSGAIGGINSNNNKLGDDDDRHQESTSLSTMQGLHHHQHHVKNNLFGAYHHQQQQQQKHSLTSLSGLRIDDQHHLLTRSFGSLVPSTHFPQGQAPATPSQQQELQIALAQAAAILGTNNNNNTTDSTATMAKLTRRQARSILQPTFDVHCSVPEPYRNRALSSSVSSAVLSRHQREIILAQLRVGEGADGDGNDAAAASAGVRRDRSMSSPYIESRRASSKGSDGTATTTKTLTSEEAIRLDRLSGFPNSLNKKLDQTRDSSLPVFYGPSGEYHGLRPLGRGTFGDAWLVEWRPRTRTARELKYEKTLRKQTEAAEAALKKQQQQQEEDKSNNNTSSQQGPSTTSMTRQHSDESNNNNKRNRNDDDNEDGNVDQEQQQQREQAELEKLLQLDPPSTVSMISSYTNVRMVGDRVIPASRVFVCKVAHVEDYERTYHTCEAQDAHMKKNEDLVASMTKRQVSDGLRASEVGTATSNHASSMFLPTNQSHHHPYLPHANHSNLNTNNNQLQNDNASLNGGSVISGINSNSPLPSHIGYNNNNHKTRTQQQPLSSNKNQRVGDMFSYSQQSPYNMASYANNNNRQSGLIMTGGGGTEMSPDGGSAFPLEVSGRSPQQHIPPNFPTPHSANRSLQSTNQQQQLLFANSVLHQNQNQNNNDNNNNQHDAVITVLRSQQQQQQQNQESDINNNTRGSQQQQQELPPPHPSLNSIQRDNNNDNDDDDDNNAPGIIIQRRSANDNNNNDDNAQNNHNYSFSSRQQEQETRGGASAVENPYAAGIFNFQNTNRSYDNSVNNQNSYGNLVLATSQSNNQNSYGNLLSSINNSNNISVGGGGGVPGGGTTPRFVLATRKRQVSKRSAVQSNEDDGGGGAKSVKNNHLQIAAAAIVPEGSATAVPPAEHKFANKVIRGNNDYDDDDQQQQQQHEEQNQNNNNDTSGASENKVGIVPKALNVLASKNKTTLNTHNNSHQDSTVTISSQHSKKPDQSQNNIVNYAANISSPGFVGTPQNISNNDDDQQQHQNTNSDHNNTSGSPAGVIDDHTSENRDAQNRTGNSESETREIFTNANFRSGTSGDSADVRAVHSTGEDNTEEQQDDDDDEGGSTNMYTSTAINSGDVAPTSTKQQQQQQQQQQQDQDNNVVIVSRAIAVNSTASPNNNDNNNIFSKINAKNVSTLNEEEEEEEEEEDSKNDDDNNNAYGNSVTSSLEDHCDEDDAFLNEIAARGDVEYVVAPFNKRVMHQNKHCREDFILANCAYPLITSYVESFYSTDSRLHLIMEYVSGGTLRNEMDRCYAKGNNYFMPERTACFLVVQILLALEYLHARNIVHRDLKASNILLSRRYIIKLADFGLSAQLEDGAGMLEPGTPVGTPEYISPETYVRSECGPKSDVWAVGIILYQLMTYEKPFFGDSHDAIRRAIIMGAFPPIQMKRPDASPEVHQLIEAMLRRNPEKRFTARQVLGLPAMQRAMKDFMEHFSTVAHEANPVCEGDLHWDTIMKEHIRMLMNTNPPPPSRNQQNHYQELVTWSTPLPTSFDIRQGKQDQKRNQKMNRMFRKMQEDQARAQELKRKLRLRERQLRQQEAEREKRNNKGDDEHDYVNGDCNNNNNNNHHQTADYQSINNMPPRSSLVFSGSSASPQQEGSPPNNNNHHNQSTMMNYPTGACSTSGGVGGTSITSPSNATNTTNAGGKSGSNDHHLEEEGGRTPTSGDDQTKQPSTNSLTATANGTGTGTHQGAGGALSNEVSSIAAKSNLDRSAGNNNHSSRRHSQIPANATNTNSNNTNNNNANIVLGAVMNNTNNTNSTTTTTSSSKQQTSHNNNNNNNTSSHNDTALLSRSGGGGGQQQQQQQTSQIIVSRSSLIAGSSGPSALNNNNNNGF